MIKKILVDRESVINNDLKKIKFEIDQIVNQYKGKNIVQQLGNLGGEVPYVSLELINSDEGTMPWEDEQNRKWAWHLMKSIPYSILFLDPESCRLIGILCLGAFHSDKYGEIIPDFKSKQSQHFLEIVDKSFSKSFCKQYGRYDIAIAASLFSNFPNPSKLTEQERLNCLLKYNQLDTPFGILIYNRGVHVLSTFLEWQQSFRKCFIATVCYGSECTPEVIILKDFRDNILNNNVLGRKCVNFYYNISPPVAEYLKHSPFLRKLILTCILKPAILLANCVDVKKGISEGVPIKYVAGSLEMY